MDMGDDAMQMDDDMPGMGGDDGGSMMMMMPMTFSRLADYDGKVLWEWWDIKTPFQFWVSALACFLAAVVFVGLRARRLDVLRVLRGAGRPGALERCGWAFYLGSVYMLGMLIMLICMTYISGLFVAVILGCVREDAGAGAPSAAPAYLVPLLLLLLLLLLPRPLPLQPPSPTPSGTRPAACSSTRAWTSTAAPASARRCSGPACET